MLHDSEYLLSTAIGFEAIEPQAKALVMLGREVEALAWMREYTPRVEAYNKAKPPVVAPLFNDLWAKIHVQGKGDHTDERLWRDWDEAERVSRKAVALAKAAEGSVKKKRPCGLRDHLGIHPLSSI
jgi:hypothetical protein